MPVLHNAPRLLGLLNRNLSSSSYGSFDREYWHYNTMDFSCARKQEAVLTLTLLYLIDHSQNKYYQSSEILGYIRGALLFWTRIQNANGSFNEWYPYENSFVVTSFSAYAVSESLLLIRDALPEKDVRQVIASLVKAGDWLTERNETRVMNQQSGAAMALLNLSLLTGASRYRNSSRRKIALLKNRQSPEGWFLEYGGPDIGYLSLAIDYLCKYYSKTEDSMVRELIDRALNFIKYFTQPDLVAGGEYTSRNTEYLIPHGFEIASRASEDAFFMAAAVRKSLLRKESFPGLFDDRYLTYVGYTWLQAFMDANPAIDGAVDAVINKHFTAPFRKEFNESGLLSINDERKHLIVNTRKGGSFRLFDKGAERAYSDSGILVSAQNKWFTSGWLGSFTGRVAGAEITVSGNMWKIPDKAMTPFSNILIRLFQMTFGRSSTISLWLKERLRDLLITKTVPSEMRYSRTVRFDGDSGEVLKVRDSVTSGKKMISSVAVLSRDTHIYVPSSRYYVDMAESPFRKDFPALVSSAEIEWIIRNDSNIDFRHNAS